MKHEMMWTIVIFVSRKEVTHVLCGFQQRSRLDFVILSGQSFQPFIIWTTFWHLFLPNASNTAIGPFREGLKDCPFLLNICTSFSWTWLDIILPQSDSQNGMEMDKRWTPSINQSTNQFVWLSTNPSINIKYDHIKSCNGLLQICYQHNSQN